MRSWLIPLLGVVLASAACKTGGEYVAGERVGGEVDRGETNGRTFDFVSNRPDGDDWQIRIRDDSMWASYADGEEHKDYGTVRLEGKEARKVWELIDTLALEERKKGRKDEDEGYVMLRLREPGGEEGHDFVTVYVSRATEDEDVIELGDYLARLLTKYHKEEPEF